MAIDLDDAASTDPGVAGGNPNPGSTETIIDPVTLLPFEQPPLSAIAADEHTGQPDKTTTDNPPPADAAGKERYEYWQSQADREKNARLALEQELRVARPIMGLIEEDEDLYKAVTARLDGAQPPGPALKAPTPPERPASYSETEAYTNPQSESFKFRAAREKYVEDRISYLEALNQQTVEGVRQREAQLAEQEQRSRVMAQTEQYVQQKFGMTPVEAREFTTWSSSDESITIPNLVAFYKFQKANGGVTRGGGGPPAPPTRGGGGAPEPGDINRAWNEAMFGKRGK